MEPSAGVIDSQSVKSAQHGSYDAGKKIKGCKRHILTDTEGIPQKVKGPRPIFKTATAANC
jgi:hypothetical protein